jgi:hypothetical protein
MFSAMPVPPTAPGVAQTVGLIIGGLSRAVAAGSARNRAAGPLLILIYGRLQRMLARFASLAERVRAGTLRPRRHRVARPRPQRKRDRLPQKFGWLVGLVPEAACFGSQLHHLLSDPAMTALLKAAPQAGRILRPLCRMLAQKPDPTLLPPPPKPAATAFCRTEPPPPPPPGATPPGAGPPGPGVERPVVVWRRWRGIRMPEIWRPPKPA